MRRSQTVLASAAGVVVAIVLLAGLWVRFAGLDGEVAAPSGQRATKSYDLSNFENVRVAGQWQVDVVRGDAWAVELSFPVEIERYLDVRTDGDDLAVQYRDQRGWWSDFGRNEKLGITAHIVMPALARLRLAGATALSFSGFEGAELEIRTSGSSKIDGTNGRYRVLDLQMSGAGTANLGGVTVTDAHVDLSGANRVTLRLDGGTLDGHVSGANNLEYSGTVSSQDVTTSGSANVRKVD
jgi:Putative auto-transporter adhesin, head GIN domain